MDEALYAPPVEDGEETKAIPIITNDRMAQNEDDADQTLVHQETVPTKNITESDDAVSPVEEKPKKKKRFRKTKWFLPLLLLVILVGILAFLMMRPPDVVFMEVK